MKIKSRLYILKKVLLITSGQPSINPRLVKEADALTGKGYEVTVLYQYWNAWATALDEESLKTKKWKAIRVGGEPVKEKGKYAISRLTHKSSKMLFEKANVKAAAVGAIARSSYYLIARAKKIKADLYIGHNLGALPAAVMAATVHNAKCGFDAEDFHRNETSDDANDKDVQLKQYVEDQFLPRVNYLTTASPLITDQYKKLYPHLSITTINNVFPKTDIAFNGHLPDEVPLKLFWFSQTIGTNRGLEEVLKAICMLPPLAIELHLLGSVAANTKKELQDIVDTLSTTHCKLFFYEPIDADKIIALAAQFHIGLATETGVPFNRDICLTNKIFTYIQAGLAVLASNTQAQKNLLNKYSDIGAIYERGNLEGLAAIIHKYYNNRTLLKQQKCTAYQVGKETLNWEEESKKFISIVQLQLQ